LHLRTGPLRRQRRLRPAPGMTAELDENPERMKALGEAWGSGIIFTEEVGRPSCGRSRRVVRQMAYGSPGRVSRRELL
ncbi:MAG: hypothetical protein M3346_10905, partial [Actinomycetota bacterium]|nr:hypothetical protein [Actinomycetota bacterium]